MIKLINKVTMTWKIHCYVLFRSFGFYRYLIQQYLNKDIPHRLFITNRNKWILVLSKFQFLIPSLFLFWRQMVAFLLIGVATYAKTSSIVVTLPIVGGMVACGVFLLFVAVLGLIATIKHHQVMLFFYMMILFVIFVIQFSVACACIGVNLEQEKKMSRTVSIRIP